MSEHTPVSLRTVAGIYRIGQIVTPGRMVTTYTAYNRNTNDIVGLFVIDVPPTFRQDMVQQLLAPLEKRRKLQSPHILHVYDWGIDGSRAYIATDPPRGITLQHVIDTENIAIARALELIKQIAAGVIVLHEAGITGLDLRPQLITVDSLGVTDRVQIDDIGLRPLLNSLGYMNNQRSDDIGYLDPRYAPPEYIHHQQPNAHSDIYQLGLLLFELVTGRLPFVGRNAAETGVLQTSSPVPAMKQYTHDTPSELQDIVNYALEKAANRRFSSVNTFLRALERVETAAPPATNQHTGAAPSARGVALTHEMAPLQEEIALRDTLIEHTTTGHSLEDEDTLYTTDIDKGTYAYLRYEPPGEPVQRIAITQKDVVVGRHDPKRGLSPDIDLSAIDPKMTISRQHARIRFEETFFYIEDLKSRNKTRLGELALTPLKAELLQHGDIVYFGSVRVRFEVPGMGKLPALKDKA